MKVILPRVTLFKLGRFRFMLPRVRIDLVLFLEKRKKTQSEKEGAQV